MARLLYKYGNSDAVKQAGLEEALLAEDRRNEDEKRGNGAPIDPARSPHVPSSVQNR